MEQLHVVNAVVLTPFFAALPISEAQLESVLEDVGLPSALYQSQQRIIPLHAAEKLLCVSAKLVGHPTFGYQSVPFVTPDMDTYVSRLPMQTGATDLDLAFDLSERINELLTGDRVFGAVHQDKFWLLKTTVATRWTSDWAVVQYGLAVLLSGMRQVFGGNLAPVALALPTATKPSSLPDDLKDIPVHLGANTTGLGFHIKDLCALRKAARAEGNLAPMASYVPLSSAQKPNLSDCALGFLKSGNTDQLVRRMAASFGVSIRSYQRRLKEVGTTHSELIHCARLELALRRLVENSCSITEIAMELGYSDPVTLRDFLSGGSE